jgi:DNA-binding NarL/FixJ family response regulator
MRTNEMPKQIPTEEPIRILVVDDHPIMRLGVAAMVSKRKDMTVVGLAGSGEEAVEQFAKLHPDIVLLDLRLPGIGGVEALGQIRIIQPDARVIILTMYEGDDDIHRAMEAGAKGYLVKGLPPEVLVAAIRKVHSGGQYIPASVSNSLATRTANTCLSPRECEVLQCLSQGKSNKDIALELGIRESTVKWHIGVILTRLDANDRTQAVIAGLERGYLHLPKPV